MGVATIWLSLVVLVPLAAVVAKSTDNGMAAFWRAVSSDLAVKTLEITLVAAALVSVINAIFGTLVAWVLVRDEFPGKRLINGLIDLPFALPTIVAGVVLLALYGPNSPVGINVAFSRVAIVMALLFVTLPFVVRSVQPVLHELDREMEEAAASLGARPAHTFRRVVLPNLRGAIFSGAALSFARAVGEFGSVVIISGNLPFKTEVASVLVYSQIESDNTGGAAAISVVLLLISLVILMALRWGGRDAH
jgi:sulfate transport system permease protein